MRTAHVLSSARVAYERGAQAGIRIRATIEAVPLAALTCGALGCHRRRSLAVALAVALSGVAVGQKPRDALRVV